MGRTFECVLTKIGRMKCPVEIDLGRSDAFDNGSDIIRYPTVILSPDLFPGSTLKHKIDDAV